MDNGVLTSALARWGFQSARHSLIAARENRVYRIDAPDGPVALRLHRPGMRSQREVASELRWMEMLDDAGLCVPSPVPAPDGSQFAIFGETLVDVVSWLDGTPLSDRTPTSEDYRRLGTLVAHMHDLADQWTIPAGFVRPHWDTEGLIGDTPLWGRFWDNPTLTPAQRDDLLRFREQARHLLANIEATADFGLIHADLVPENILAQDSALCAIDFDDGGFGFRLFDLATVTNRSRRIAPDGNLANAFLESYASHRPLDIMYVPLFEALRACTYLGWIMPRMSEPLAKERNTTFIATAMARIAAVPSQ